MNAFEDRAEAAEERIQAVFARLEGKDWVRAQERYAAALQVIAGELEATYPLAETSPDGRATVQNPVEERKGSTMTNDVTEAGFLRPKVVGWEHFAPEPARELRELSERVVGLEGNVDKVAKHEENLRNLDETLTGWETDQSATNGEFRRRIEALETGYRLGELNSKEYVRRAENRLVEALEDDDPEKAGQWLDVLERLTGGE